MTGVARRARPDRSIVVRLAHAVALGAAARGRRGPFELRQRMRGAARPSRLVALGECDLVRLQCVLTEDSRPRSRRVAAAEVLLIDRFVAASTVAGRQLRRDHEAVMVLLRLALGRLMTVEAVDAALRVAAQLVFMDDRVLLPGMALGALARRAHEVDRGLFGLNPRPGAIHEKRADDQSTCHDNRD